MSTHALNAHTHKSADMKLYYSLSIALIVLTLDLATKYWVQTSMVYGQQIPVTDFFNLVLTYNTGAAFSILSEASGWQRWFLSAIAAGASIIIIYMLNKYKTEQLFCLSLSLILGGAIGNLWDRITLGYVVDFLDFYIGEYHWPAFNIADSAIFVGAALLIIDSFYNKKSTSEEINGKSDGKEKTEKL
ncbi:signal peptidase II Aspartic peptidase. MEROPS family A08 [Nitrosomonas marina]|uniref:Lipoprotein signal peptidase n=2 Tax=Nitrosomonas marina TaxID=917 RepID=A0A1I0DSW1_9PROT|nr:signal peptidase II Aspartic peptidase. MEROPS family A08 [Nitrosomonas marina]